jgi:hypothetical protein
MLPLSEAQSKQIEALIAWGSIAYAAGFVTVTVYTARLGIPVIQILQPVYIWIGFPLALVIFSLGWLSRMARTRLLRALDEYKGLQTTFQSVVKRQKRNEVTVEAVVDVYIEIMTALGRALVVPIHIAQPLRPALIAMLAYEVKNKDKTKQQKKLNRYYFWLSTSAIFFQGVIEAYRLLIFTSLLLLIPVACYVYIVTIYPTIPQSLGGGKPQPVVLMVKMEDVALYDPQISALFPAMPAAPTPPATRMTKQLDLLYATEQVYYVRAANGHIVSLAKDLVQGVLWNPP